MLSELIGLNYSALSRLLAQKQFNTVEREKDVEEREADEEVAGRVGEDLDANVEEEVEEGRSSKKSTVDINGEATSHAKSRANRQTNRKTDQNF